MAAGKHGWKNNKLIARAILHDRAARRKLMARMLWFVLAWMAAGLWLLDRWLAENLWCFLGWWAFCAIATLVLMLFALYDALAVIREERGRR